MTKKSFFILLFSFLSMATVEAAEIVVVAGDVGTSSTGNWMQASGATQPYNGNRGVYALVTEPVATYTFSVVIPETTQYTVQVYNTCYVSRSNQVSHQINHADGSDIQWRSQNCEEDLSLGGTWSTLGVYNFTAGAPGSVVIDTTGSNNIYVGATAVRFLYTATVGNFLPVITTANTQLFAEEGAIVEISATAQDIEDGDLTSLIQWSARGQSGMGESFSVVAGSTDFMISLEVTDNDGATVVQAVNVLIQAPGAVQIRDDFAGDGPLLGYTTNNPDSLPDVARVGDRYRALVENNDGNKTLHFNQAQGRLDAKVVTFPFEYIARNVGIGTEDESQTAPPFSDNPYIFAGIQVHDLNLELRNSSHIVVGHRGGTELTVEGKNTLNGESWVSDEGATVAPLGRADLRVVGNPDNTLTLYWQQPNLSPATVEDAWDLYKGHGYLPLAGDRNLSTDQPVYADSVYIGLITYAQTNNSNPLRGLPFVGTADGIEFTSSSAPAAPSDLSASVISASQVDLSWTDNSNDELGFTIEFSTDGGANYNELASVGANITSYSHSGLNENSTYYYRLFLYNESGNSGYSNTVSATTPSLNLNNTPTEIQLDNTNADSVAENTALGTVISVLSSTDADAGDTHSYTLVEGEGAEDNAKFSVSGIHLILAFTPDYEAPTDLGDTAGNNRYAIRLQTNDGNEGIYQQSFIITVTDIDEVDDPVADDPVTDTVAPVIELIGNSYQRVILGTAYIDLGATATDDVQGDLTPNIMTDVSAVDVSTVGVYEVIYSVSDGSNTARETRIVDVREAGIVDSTPPVIILLGVNPQKITLGNAYVELGATAADDMQGDLTLNIETDVSAVDVSTVGVYEVIYGVSDGVNTAEVRRMVIVDVLLDTTPPVITLKGDALLTITLGNAYVELGAIASDDIDGDITANITIDASVLNISLVGSYIVTYKVSDAEGNAATEITRTVNVVNDSATTTTAIKLSALDGSLLGLGLILLVFRLRRF